MNEDEYRFACKLDKAINGLLTTGRYSKLCDPEVIWLIRLLQRLDGE